MYEIGESIIHPRYGAGTVVGIRLIELNGEEKKYNVIQLVGGRGEVLTPSIMMEDMDIRLAMKNTDVIEDVFSMQPDALDDDYRERQAKIQKMIDTRHPRQMAQALRDLAWREFTDKLTGVEQKMKTQLIKMLSREMALVRPAMDVELASNHLTIMLQNMIEEHRLKQAEEAASS